MKKSKIYNLIQKELKKQLKEQPKPKAFSPSDAVLAKEKEASLGKNQGDTVQYSGAQSTCNGNASYTSGVQVYLEDVAQTPTLFGVSDWTSYPSLPAAFATQATNEQVTNMIAITQQGNVCIGPFDIPNNWLCCNTDNPDSADYITAFDFADEPQWANEWQGWTEGFQFSSNLWTQFGPFYR